jgi:hypothetical protein
MATNHALFRVLILNISPQMCGLSQKADNFTDFTVLFLVYVGMGDDISGLLGSGED